MINWKIKAKAIAIKTIIALFGVLAVAGAFKWYGGHKYTEGFNAAITAQVSATNEVLTDNAKIWRDIRNENSKITDRVAAGASLGILRPDNLR